VSPEELADIDQIIQQHGRLDAEFRAIEVADIDRAIEQYRYLDAGFKVLETAVADDSISTRRVVEWAWKRLGQTGPAPRVKRFERGTAPFWRGVVFPELAPNEVFARDDAKSPVLIHEVVHIVRPELSESQVRSLTAELWAEGNALIPFLPAPRKEVVDWCH
jgi:hypothetical protein